MDYASCGSYPLTCLAYVTLPVAYAPASIAVQVIEARKPRLHDKAVVLEEGQIYYFIYLFFSDASKFRSRI
jgi:hypothetical protein